MRFLFCLSFCFLVFRGGYPIIYLFGYKCLFSHPRAFSNAMESSLWILNDPRRLPDRTAPVCLLPSSSDPVMDGYCEYFGVWELGLFSDEGPISNHYYNTFFYFFYFVTFLLLSTSLWKISILVSFFSQRFLFSFNWNLFLAALSVEYSSHLLF